jgi:hypothetical protein
MARTCAAALAIIDDAAGGESAQLIDMTSFQESRHSRVLLAGIQAEFGLDPRLRHSGVTFLKVAVNPTGTKFLRVLRVLRGE